MREGFTVIQEVRCAIGDSVPAEGAHDSHEIQPLDEGAYQRLVHSVIDYAIFMLDRQGRVISWNAGAERIKGYSAREIVGKHFSCFYPPEDVEAGVPFRALKTAAEEGRFTAEGWRLRKDGTRFWALVAIDRIQQDGEVIGFAKITRDITEQHEAALDAMESERRFRLLVQGVTDYAIYMLNPEGEVTNWNTGAERIKGYAAAEIVGQHFSRFYTPEDIEAKVPWKALEAARRDGRYHAEGWRRRKDGSRFWASIVVDAVRDDNGTLIGFAKVTRDLTERREAQIELERSREQLFQAQKMEAVGQLTGGIAHDFNNLLTGISGSLELMRTRLGQGRINELDRYIAGAQGAARRAASLTQRLLAFARKQTLEPTAVDANRLILELEELIARTVGPQVTLEKRLAPDLWPCFCDPNQLETSILNLCINARDAMPEGGGLTIGTSNVHLDESSAQARDVGPGDYISIRVTDTGTGMPQDVIDRAFEPFFTTKPLGKGTGLGLSMIYGFTKQSGGVARIASELGKGTTVEMQLPRHDGEFTEEVSSPEETVESRAEAGETVLVVDDEPIVRMLVSEALSELGYRSIEAADGPSALRVLDSDVRIDLLISDVGLPGGMNGRQIADAARSRRKDLKVLFITGYAETNLIGTESLEWGMHVMTKPFSMDKLAAKIRAIITGDQ